MADHRPTTLALIALIANDPATVDLLRELVEAATAARRDLLAARDRDDVERVRRLRRLLAALYPDVSANASDNGNAEAVAAGPLSSSDRVAVIVSVQEAAEVLQLTTRRVTQLCEAGDLAGEQDAPGRPWRVPLTSVHAYRDQRTEEPTP